MKQFNLSKIINLTILLEIRVIGLLGTENEQTTIGTKDWQDLCGNSVWFSVCKQKHQIDFGNSL